MPINLRRITGGEALKSTAIIVQAYAQAPWHEEWSVENATLRLSELVTTPGCLAWAAFEAEDPIGFAFGLPHTSAIGRGLHVAEIAILPGHQRKGIGTRLLRRLEEEARNIGYLHVWLVSQQTGGVAEYYRRCGYSQSSKLRVYTKRLEQGSSTISCE
jgi:GNAT superfamily N-acetyltransferase